jgi:two-component system sensor histidine kinase UhpB
MHDVISAQALRESEELHRVTLLSMSDAVFITTDEGAFTFICPNVDVIFGYREDEVRAMGRISQLLGRDVPGLEHLTSTGEIRNIEHDVAAKDGTRRVLLIHVKRVSIKHGTVMYVCRDITERKQSDDIHRWHEEQLKLALEAASAGTWDWDVPTGSMHWSEETYRIFGDTTQACAPSPRSFLDRVHPRDRERVVSTISAALDHATAYETEFRVLGLDDVERWVLGKGKAFINGKSRRMLGVFLDVTARHRVEHEVRDLGGRLVDAHERERRRLSAELHDGVGQRLAVLAAELALLREEVASSPLILDQVDRILAHAGDVSTELHRLSHDLHPASLEQLGLSASIRRVCDELSRAHRITIRLEIAALPAGLTNDVALCVYRIVQEALHNVVKHSGAAIATVRLEVDHGEVVLNVVDDGKGLDPLVEHAIKGVGLISMRERARQVEGHLTLTSRPGLGTQVQVRVPLVRSTTGKDQR